MELWVLVGIMASVIVALLIKIYSLKKVAKEIEEDFADRLTTGSNTLISISSRDRHMRKLAAGINRQLCILRNERHRFQQGDLEMKEAITNIAHDLRTPLTAICGYMDLLEREEKSEKVNGYLEVIRERTEVLKSLMEELFKTSVVAATLANTIYETVVLNSVLEESICVYYGALKKVKITPTICIPEHRIERKLDPNALSRIFGNIISNAIKYSDGDLNITLLENGEITFSNRATELSEIQVGRLFDRFYTVEAAEKSTGLGLSIAKMLTEQMNGTISAQYKDGVISIRIYFPMINVENLNSRGI